MGELLRVHPANGRKSKTTLQRHPARKWFLTPTPISLPCRIRLFLRLWSSNSRKNQVILQLWFQCQKYHAVPPLPGKPSLQNIWTQQQLRKLSYQDWIKKVVTFQTNSLWVKPWFPLPNSPPPHQKKKRFPFGHSKGQKQRRWFYLQDSRFMVNQKLEVSTNRPLENVAIWAQIAYGNPGPCNASPNLQVNLLQY